MENKTYETPTAEKIEFDFEDNIVASSGCCDPHPPRPHHPRGTYRPFDINGGE